MLAFIKNVEDLIYTNESIYRTLFVVNTQQECEELQTLLNSRDYSSIIVNDIDKSINYHNIDQRIVIIHIDNFEEFINYLMKTNCFENSYNLIGFSYSISESQINNLKEYYLFVTNNNISNTILFDKKYCE